MALIGETRYAVKGAALRLAFLSRDLNTEATRRLARILHGRAHGALPRLKDRQARGCRKGLRGAQYDLVRGDTPGSSTQKPSREHGENRREDRRLNRADSALGGHRDLIDERRADGKSGSCRATGGRRCDDSSGGGGGRASG